MTTEKDININKESQIKYAEEIRPLGFTVSAVLALVSLVMAQSIVPNMALWDKEDFSWVELTSDIGCILMSIYFIICCAVSDYLIGKPSKLKIAPLALGGLLTFIAGIAAFFFQLRSKRDKDIYFFLEFLSPIPFLALAYFTHFLDDDEESTLLMLKPWRNADSVDSSSV